VAHAFCIDSGIVVRFFSENFHDAFFDYCCALFYLLGFLARTLEPTCKGSVDLLGKGLSSLFKSGVLRRRPVWSPPMGVVIATFGFTPRVLFAG
jgi:hypothetical protein